MIWLYFAVLAISLIGRAAVGQFTGCDYYQTVEVGRSYDVFSPGYSANYRANTNCRWAGVAPQGYKVVLTCTDVVMPSSTSCSADRIEVSPTGRTDLADAHRYCGRGTFNTESTGNSLIVALRVPATTVGGRFLCQMRAQAICQCGRRKTSRIVGGVETQINEFPMMAAIVDTATNQVLCGATIIDNNYVLTAAHCLRNRAIGSYIVRVGDHDVTTTAETSYSANYGVRSALIHPSYAPATMQNDVAIITVSTPIVYNVGVGPACLPFKFTTNTFAGSTVEAAGWGTVEFGGPRSPRLQRVTLNGISTSECQSRLSNITPTQLCTYSAGRDTCQYDSGGPLYYTDPSNGLVYDVGVVSFGVACASSSPGVATRTTSYLDWITANTPGANYCRI